MNRNRTIIWAALLLAGAVATAQAGEGAAEGDAAPESQAPAAAVPELRAAPEPGRYLRLDGEEHLRGVTRVLLPYFQVEFVTKSWANAMAVGKDATAATGVSFDLKGVGDAELQALTQRLYEQTVAGLQTAGIEVVALDTVAAQPAYQALADWEKPSPHVLDAKGRIARFFAPQGHKLYFDPGDARFSLASNFGGMFTTKRHPIVLESDLYKETGIAVMRVRFVIDFTERKAKKSSVFSSGAKASAEGRVQLALVPEGTRMLVNTTGKLQPNIESDARAILKLKEALVAEDSGFVREVREINAGANTAKSVGVAVLSIGAALSGVGGVKPTVASQKDYEVEVDGAAYAVTVEQLAADALRLFVQAAQAHR